jgi:TatD-related deoxyribonuclease
MATPILDNHAHLEPLIGRHVEAVRDFEGAGGTHIIISHLPYDHVRVSTADDFRKGFEETVRLKERVNSETGVRAFATVGPYPVELLHLEKRFGLERAKDLMMRGMDTAAEFVREGKALAIGEVGRPHFPVSTEQLDASNDIMSHAMRLGKELGCAVVLHTESATPESMRGLAEMADRAGLPRWRLVKHYCSPLVLDEENHGLMPSVLAGKDAVKEALRKGTRFMLETDFLDDPRRPGAVLDIVTVPKRTKAMMDQGLMTQEQALIIHQENPRRTYGDAFS